jgi:hypothetical protein
MKVKVGVIVGSIIVIFIVTFLFLYQFFGLKYIINAISSINSPTTADQERSYSLLSGTDSPNSLNRGILARINSNKNNLVGIWIWNLRGLYHYRAGDETKLSLFSICNGEKWKNPAKINKEIDVEFKEWLNRSKQGDYVEISLSDNGKIIEEVSVYDWWVFISPMPFEYFQTTCKNR